MMNRKHFFAALLVCSFLVMQLSQAVLAAPAPELPKAPQLTLPVAAADASLASYGTVLSEDEMAAVDGRWGHIVTGILSGMVSSAIHYILVDEDPTLGEFGMAVAKGAATGAVGAAVATAAMVAKGASMAYSAAETAWGCWAAAHAGAFSGAYDRVQSEGMLNW